MVYRLYDLILLLATVLLLPYGFLKGLRYGAVLRGLGERLAFYDADRLKPLRGKRVIWIHAVSVGETRASVPLIRQLRDRYPDAAIVLSSLTYTGRATADEIDEADLCVFLPYDHSRVIRRALKQISPDIILLVETEIWPNFIRLSSRQEIPIVMVNGRISDRSFPRYWPVRRLLAPLLQNIDLLCMQSRQDELRIVRLGAASANVKVTGNLKFDLPAPEFTAEDIDAFRSSICLPTDVPIWVAGSTRQGEEEIVLESFRRLLEEGRKLILVLVPRYPDRAKGISDLIDKAGFAHELRSQVGERGRDLCSGEILVGDSLGEMLKFYACADVVFVGGSLVPIGGHNILEASLLEKPVLFGPYMQNFRTISRLLLEAGGGFQVDADGLQEKVGELLENPDLSQSTGSRGKELFSAHSGATSRTVDAVDSILAGVE